MDKLIMEIAHIFEILISLIGAFLMAAMGVAMRYGHMISQGISFTYRKILWDIPTVMVMGVLAGSTGKYLQQKYLFPEEIIWALAANFGYFGPKILDRIATHYFEKGGKPPKADGE